MTISSAADVSDSERSPLLHNYAGGGVVDYQGRPADRSKTGCWRSAFFIIGVEFGERFAYYGISSNLINYLTGSLGQSKARAAENVNTWYGVASVTPLLGAFIADSYLGRYRTILIASLLYILGLSLLTLSAVLPSVSSPDCKNGVKTMTCSPSQFQVIFFFFSWDVECKSGQTNKCQLHIIGRKRSVSVVFTSKIAHVVLKTTAPT